MSAKVNKVIAISGGATGIGRATVELFLKEHALYNFIKIAPKIIKQTSSMRLIGANF